MSLAAAERQLERRGRPVTLVFYTRDGEDPYDEPQYREAVLEVKAIRQDERKARVIHDARGREREVSTTFYVSARHAFTVPDGVRAPELVDGLERFEVLGAETRSGAGFTRLSCERMRIGAGAPDGGSDS